MIYKELIVITLFLLLSMQHSMCNAGITRNEYGLFLNTLNSCSTLIDDRKIVQCRNTINNKVKTEINKNLEQINSKDKRFFLVHRVKHAYSLIEECKKIDVSCEPEVNLMLLNEILVRYDHDLS